MVRVRNQLGFHWDPSVIAPAVAAITDEPLIWIEGRGLSEGASVYRFAADVLVNALIPESLPCRTRRLENESGKLRPT